MSNSERLQVLRYAELVMRDHQGRRPLTREEKDEMTRIQEALGMSHESILELAARNLLPED